MTMALIHPYIKELDTLLKFVSSFYVFVKNEKILLLTKQKRSSSFPFTIYLSLSGESKPFKHKGTFSCFMLET